MQQKTEIPWPPPFSSWMPPDSQSRPPPPPPSGDSESFVIRLIIAFAFSLLAVFLCSSCCKGYRNIQARAAAAAATERRTRQDPRARNGELLPPPARPRLPAFKYDRSVKHNVTGGGEEAKTCSVCLGAFQFGETVRLLPACLHLYHAECIDPWLDAHSTCPICRSDTDPTMGVGRPPPV